MENINITAKITEEQIKRIQKILKNTDKQKINIKGAIEWFDKVYIKQISKFIDINDKILCDCACGYGWFSFAYLLNRENNKAICIDLDKRNLEIAKSISEILEVRDRIKFKIADITKLPLNSKSVNIFASIETLEHVGDNPELQMKYYYGQEKDKVMMMFKIQRELQLMALEEINRATSEAVIIATPNRYYFKDHHDTGLKFVHWMPRYIGIQYSLKFSKEGYFHAPLHSRFLSHNGS